MTRSIAPLVAACLLTVAARVDAQRCLGQAGFEAGRLRAGASYASLPSSASGPSGSQLGVNAFYGFSADGGFALGTVARVSDGVSGHPSVTTGTIGVGYQFPVDVGALCPMVTVQHFSVPNQTSGDTTISQSANQIGLGAAVGFPVKLNDQMQWRPFVGFSFQSYWSNATLTAGGVSGPSPSNTTFTELEAGIGIVINLRVTVQPSYVDDFGYRGGGASRQKYVLGVVINVGPQAK